LDYDVMNCLAASVPPGSCGITAVPFGNGAERVLENTYPGAQILGLDLNRHSLAHVLRAVQEGIACSFRYGIEIMSGLGLHPSVIRAGKANLFLSDVFAETLATLTGATIELYNTDGSLGAARGAALGAGYYRSREETFASLSVLKTVEPQGGAVEALREAYGKWKKIIDNQ
ncbi:MAG: carbohydrate kinase, partial [Bacteroidales bacterium]|nr:carbohydrate kinase [Bacteroidales bacterium]